VNTVGSIVSGKKERRRKQSLEEKKGIAHQRVFLAEKNATLFPRKCPLNVVFDSCLKQDLQKEEEELLRIWSSSPCFHP